MSRSEQFQDDKRTLPVTDVETEVRSRQMKFLPPVGNDVTEDDKSDGDGHLERVE